MIAKYKPNPANNAPMNRENEINEAEPVFKIQEDEKLKKPANTKEPIKGDINCLIYSYKCAFEILTERKSQERNMLRELKVTAMAAPVIPK